METPSVVRGAPCLFSRPQAGNLRNYPHFRGAKLSPDSSRARGCDLPLPQLSLKLVLAVAFSSAWRCPDPRGVPCARLSRPGPALTRSGYPRKTVRCGLAESRLRCQSRRGNVRDSGQVPEHGVSVSSSSNNSFFGWPLGEFNRYPVCKVPGAY